MVNIFRHLATLMGAKNIKDFVVKNPTVAPDEVVQKEAQKGNLVPVGTVETKGVSGGSTG